MFDNKIISLLLLCMVVGTASCKRKIEYVYENVTVTRYDHAHFSEYYSNQTDANCKIRVSGLQNFYTAWLCINRETKKIWILRNDCLIEQPIVDYTNFQAELYDYPNNIDSTYTQELTDIHRLITENPKLLEEKYAVHILCGLGDYVDAEIEWNKEEFPNSKIHPIY